MMARDVKMSMNATITMVAVLKCVSTHKGLSGAPVEVIFSLVAGVVLVGTSATPPTMVAVLNYATTRKGPSNAAVEMATDCSVMAGAVLMSMNAIPTMVAVLKCATTHKGPSNATVEVATGCSVIAGAVLILMSVWKIPSCQHYCNNTIGSYECFCREGYFLATDGRDCTDIDECMEDPNSCQHYCNSNSYGCSCREGYLLATDRRNCTNECIDDTHAHDCQHHCSKCRDGYSLAPNGRNCIDVNECQMENGGCSQDCTNTDGSYHCSCENDYMLEADKRTCTGDLVADNSSSTVGALTAGLLGTIATLVLIIILIITGAFITVALLLKFKKTKKSDCSSNTIPTEDCVAYESVQQPSRERIEINECAAYGAAELHSACRNMPEDQHMYEPVYLEITQ